VERVRQYIDWNPFFALWQLRGRYPNRNFPKIFDDERVGPEARRVHAEANALLSKHITELSIEATVAFYPAASSGDDILVRGL
jgi:5-methyltetrahydrofolate--homocysteine methyltransferase